MTFALPMLIGGAAFMAAWTLGGTLGVAAVGLALLALELVHDLRLYRKPDRGVER